MARTIPPLNSVNRMMYLILRSLYYKQNLPQELLSRPSDTSSTISALLRIGAIRQDRSNLILTRMGIKRLYGLAGGKPRMIDPDEQNEVVSMGGSAIYLVEGSEAIKMAKRVSE